MSKIWRRRRPEAGQKTADGRLLAFKADEATEEQLREVYDFLKVAHAHDWPESDLNRNRNRADQDRYDAFVAALFRRGSPESDGRICLFLVRGQGWIVASIAYTVGGGVDRDLAVVDITVHPQARGQGIGTAVLRAMIPAIRATGRTRIRSASVRSGDSERWAWNVGFRPVERGAVQQLVVAGADPLLWDVPTPVGYRLQSWNDTTPEEILEAYARARQAFEDLVDHGLTASTPDWTPERIREDEADSAAKNTECRVVVAVYEATGEIVGMTETGIFSAEPEIVSQAYTAVVREHQGNGLGRAMKAAMMRRLLDERPDIVTVRTQAVGAHIAQVNRGLGYQTAAEYVVAEAAIEQLERTLAALS